MSVTFASSSNDPFTVLIVGGGVAGLEAALALRDLCGKRIATTIIAPNPEFVYRPMTVREPFGYAEAQRYSLAEIAQDIGLELQSEAFKWLDRERRVVHTEQGEQLAYDALLLALGARLHPRYKHALTIDDRRLDELLHGLIQDVEGGYVHSLAFVIPSGKAWPLPFYELALLTAGRAYDMNVELSVTIATPEDAPLAIFGLDVSESVRQLLEEDGITTITSAHCEVHEPGRVSIHPGSRHLDAERIVALPELVGPFAIKHGGIAAQQADVAAQAIAAFAGLADEPDSFRPVIHGLLLTRGKPRYLSAHVTGGYGSSSEITDMPTWSPATKIVAKYLGLYLEERDRIAVSTT